MIPAVAIRKATGLDGIVDKYIPTPIEEPKKRKGVVPASSALDAALHTYDVMFKLQIERKKRMAESNEYHDEPVRSKRRTSNFIKRLFKKQILTPVEITTFSLLSEMREETNDRQMKVDYWMARGLVITTLIGRSYRAGHNDFTFIGSVERPFFYCGLRLRASPHRKLRITVNGNVGLDFSQFAHNIEYTLWGSLTSLAGGFAEHAVGCTFTLLDRNPPFDYNSSLVKQHDYPPLANHARRCAFKTVHQQQAEYLAEVMKHYLPDNGNLVFYIDQHNYEHQLYPPPARVI